MKLFSLKSVVKLLPISILMLFFFCVLPKPSYAVIDAFQNAKDTISTSRPSAVSPLSANAASGVDTLSIFNNGSFFLASDSAKIVSGNGTLLNSSLVIASQSGALTSVYLGNTVTTAAGAGADLLMAPVTAMHTVQFTTRTDIPISGTITLTFPGGANTSASPSATTFAFNGLTTANAAANISYKLNSGGTATCTTITVSAPSITCTTTGAIIIAGSTITFLIGCTDASTNETSCTTQSPRLINPTKTATAGTADIWRLSLASAASLGGTVLDGSSISIGTIESVTVRATVDPTLTFTITGTTTSSDAVNFGNTTGCSDTEPTSTGIVSTSTDVNLGTLSNTPAVNTTVRNINAQRIDITSNGPTGYTLVATSSGHLMDPAIGFFINDNTTPTAFPAGTNYFGLHPCGLNVLSGSGYVEGGGAGGASCLTRPAGSAATECNYAWPTVTTSIPIASKTSGVTGATAATTGDGITSIAYAAGVDANVPPGQYRAVITYIATPGF